MNPSQDNIATARPADILAVDDTPANLQVVSGILKASGYKVRPVPGGKLALLAAQRAPPDLILLDINMPEMNGYEVCCRLKSDDKLRGIPVIFVSGLTEQLDKVKAFAVGAVDYVTKPFHMEELLARVETHLKIRRLQIEMEQTNAQLETANLELKLVHVSLAARVVELEQSAAKIKELDDLLPMCAWCRKIRDDHTYWDELEKFVTKRTEGRISRGICPPCLEKIRPGSVNGTAQ